MPRDDFLDGLLDAPLLTKHEEQRLALVIRAGRDAAAEAVCGGTDPHLVDLVTEGQRARELFVESNLRLVASLVLRRPPVHGISDEDLFQAGVLGLQRAVDLFEPDKGFKFSTYATNWIKQALGRFTDRNRSSLSGNASELGGAFAATQRGDELSDKQRLALQAATPMSGDAALSSDGDGLSLFETLAGHSNTEDEAVAELELAEVAAAVRCALDDLPPSTRRVIEQRFGIGCEPMPMVALAAQLGLSTEGVRRRIRRGLDHMRRPLEVLVA
ncbi:MAG: sigma-70 family RNA polymerase sigma factor [Actinomycetia bacterium]|nr:sigma-70 family RNA polymerase sigma factor [Actinomycetes bacterium]